MPRRIKWDKLLEVRGFIYSAGLVGPEIIAPSFGGSSYSCIDGQNCWARNTRIEGALGPGPAGGPMVAVAVLMNVGNTYGGTTNVGSVVQYFNQYVGAAAAGGNMVVGNVSVGALQGAGVLTEVPVAGGTPVKVGVNPPTSAPVIAVGASPGKNTGTASILITCKRSATGEESNRGPVSNVIQCSGQGVNITSTAAAMGMDTTCDTAVIYGSQSSFSTVGPWFKLYEVAKTALNGNYPIQLPNSTLPGWYDGEVGVVAPIENNIPLTCSFVASLNNVLLAVGVAGNGISPTIPGQIGAFPPEFIVFLSGGGTITWCKGTGFDGQLLVGTTNSTYLVRVMGGTASPISVVQVYPTTGFPNGNLVCTVQSELYGWTGMPIRGGIAEDSGIDTSFGATAETKIRTLGACTAVVYDPHTDCVLYCFGSNILPWDRRRQHWQAVQVMSAPITTGVTDGQICRLSDASGNLVQLEAGSGVAWFAFPDFREGQYPGMDKTVRYIGAAGNTTLTLDVYKNANLSSSAFSVGAVDCSSESVITKVYVRLARSFTMKVSGTGTLVSGGPQAFYRGIMGYVPHEVAS